LKSLASALVLLCLTAGLVACGSSNSTDTAAEEAQAAKLEELRFEKETAEQKAMQAQAEAKKEVRAVKRSVAKEKAASESAPEPEPESEEAPDVIGMRLPAAESTLLAAGYTTEPENTDTTFGIVVPSHYTVCEQSEPHGSVVNVLAQKYGC
jgi:uncharacterized lipoprotein